MTGVEIVKEKLAVWGIDYSTPLISAGLKKLGANPLDEIDSHTIDLFLYNLIPELLMMPNSVSQGGYSVAFDKSSMLSYYNLLCRKLNKTNLLARSTITDISNRW